MRPRIGGQKWCDYGTGGPGAPYVFQGLQVSETDELLVAAALCGVLRDAWPNDARQAQPHPHTLLKVFSGGEGIQWPTAGGILAGVESVVGPQGFEPWTNGLKVHCSSS